MLRARENLLSIREQSASEQMVENTTIKAIKLLAKENEDLAQIIEYGHDALDGLLEKKQQRQKYVEKQIKDMREDIYWKIGELILEMENFDSFGRVKRSKLKCLKKPSVLPCPTESRKIYMKFLRTA